MRKIDQNLEIISLFSLIFIPSPSPTCVARRSVGQYDVKMIGIYLCENSLLIQIIFHATFSEKVAQKGRKAQFAGSSRRRR